MPYIVQQKRTLLDHGINELVVALKEMELDDDNNTEGNLNYIITTLLVKVYGPNWRYKKINDATGVLACAMQEFYRRVAGPYEDKAIEKNGDVY